jgi:hypothetical protein
MAAETYDKKEVMLQYAVSSKAALGPLSLERDSLEAHLKIAIKSYEDLKKKYGAGHTTGYKKHPDTIRKELEKTEAKFRNAKERLLELQRKAAMLVGQNMENDAAKYQVWQSCLQL